MYRYGQGVPQDAKAAIEWYTLAAEHNDVGAQTDLGYMYANGEGVLKNFVRAHMFYNIAASNGSNLASANRDAVATEMTPADIKKAREQARKYVASGYKESG